MPESDRAATRQSAAKNGAMKLHQSALALLPCTKISPGWPVSPQVSNSMSGAQHGDARTFGRLGKRRGEPGG